MNNAVTSIKSAIPSNIATKSDLSNIAQSTDLSNLATKLDVIKNDCYYAYTQYSANFSNSNVSFPDMFSGTVPGNGD